MWAGNSMWEDDLACGSSERCKGQVLGFDFSCSEEQKFVPLCKSRITPRKVSAYSHSYFQDLC